MTTSDKTGEKLVQSIRKTKASSGSTSPATATDKPAAAAPAKKAAVKKKVSAKASPRKPATPAKAAAKAKPTKAAIDNYQSSRRVWPD